MMQYLESDRNGVWAARTQTGMEVWLGWLAAFPNLAKSSFSPCILRETGERLPLAGPGAETQTGHTDSVVSNEESARYFINVSGATDAHLCITARSRLFTHYSGAERKMFRNALEKIEDKISRTFDFVSLGHVQHTDSE